MNKRFCRPCNDFHELNNENWYFPPQNKSPRCRIRERITAIKNYNNHKEAFINRAKKYYSIELAKKIESPEDHKQLLFKRACNRRIWAKQNPDKIKKYKKSENPLHLKARDLVKKAKLAKLIIPEPCSVCGTNENIEAHHEDYNKPLEVIWLCSYHHRKHHKVNSF